MFFPDLCGCSGSTVLLTHPVFTACKLAHHWISNSKKRCCHHTLFTGLAFNASTSRPVHNAGKIPWVGMRFSSSKFLTTSLSRACGDNEINPNNHYGLCPSPNSHCTWLATCQCERETQVLLCKGPHWNHGWPQHSNAYLTYTDRLFATVRTATELPQTPMAQ